VTVQNHVLGLDQVGMGGQLADVQVVDEAMLAGFYETNVEKLFRFLARRAGRDDGAEILSQVFEEFFAWWPDIPRTPTRWQCCTASPVSPQRSSAPRGAR
jgi:hypothetical protein